MTPEGFSTTILLISVLHIMTVILCSYAIRIVNRIWCDFREYSHR